MRQNIDLDVVWHNAFRQAADALTPYRIVIPPGVPQRCPFTLDEILDEALTYDAALHKLYEPIYMSPSSARAPTRIKEAPMTDAHSRIDSEVKSNDVVLFMKGTPQFPMCGFSGQVVQILGYLGVPYKGVNVLEDQEIREGIKSYSNWPTIPQLYVKGEFVGGCDIVREMYQSGELVELLKAKGVPTEAAA